jgi:hypothetical protein
LYENRWGSLAATVSARKGEGTQFTCFTGTKVQILKNRWGSLAATVSARKGEGTQFTCFTGAKVKILTRSAVVVLRSAAYSVYLLYRCKSKNTDAVGCSGASICRLLCLLALLVRKYKY